MLEFHLDMRSGVVPYLQIVQQVKQALRMGVLTLEEQLPTVREVVATLAINPNTVLKAYRELEHEGLIASRPGLGTFVVRTLAGSSPAQLATLRRSLTRWLQSAMVAGLEHDDILALFQTTLHQFQKEETA